MDGIGVYSFNLARHLIRMGHRVTIVTRGSVRMNRMETEGMELVSLPFFPVYPFHVHLHGIFVNRYLSRHRDRFDIFHAHSPLAPVLTEVKPVVTTFHAPVANHGLNRIDDALSFFTRLQVPVSRRLEQGLLLRSRAIAVVDPQLTPEIERRVAHAVPVTVLANGVDTERFFPDATARDSDLVISVGRLQHGKGFDDLIAAWPQVLGRHPTARLEIVGDGPLLGRLRTIAKELGVLGSIRFTGAVSPTESGTLLRAYQRAALVVQASHHEGLSTVVLEAMAVGVPIVATNVGGHATVIDAGVDGMLVPPGDRRALSAAISKVLGLRDADEMGARARQKVVSSYSWTSIAEAYEAWYASVLHD